MLKPSLLLLVGIVGLPLQADQDTGAYRLLKSWGMQFDASGKLYFKSEQENSSSPGKRWAPDVSAYQLRKPPPVNQFLEPLVIRSKQAAKK